MSKGNKKKIIAYVISLAVSFGMVALIYLYQKDYHGTTLKEQYMMLSNSFFVAGVLYVGFGAIILISLTGNFIGVQFVFKQAGQIFMNFFTGRYQKLDYISYKAEKEAKEETRSKDPGKWRPLIVGVVNVIISVVFLRLYYSI